VGRSKYARDVATGRMGRGVIRVGNQAAARDSTAASVEGTGIVRTWPSRDESTGAVVGWLYTPAEPGGVGRGPRKGGAYRRVWPSIPHSPDTTWREFPRLRGRPEGALGHADQGQHLAPQARQLGMEDLDGVTLTQQGMALGEAEQA